MSGFKRAAPVFNADFGLVYRYNNGLLVQRCDHCQGILQLRKKTDLWNCQKCGRITNDVYWSTDEMRQIGQTIIKPKWMAKIKTSSARNQK